MEENLVKQLVLNLIFSGGMSGIVYWFLNKPFGQELVRRIALWTEPNFEVNASQVVRMLAMVLSPAFSLGLYALAMALFQWVPNPGGVVDWLNLLLVLGGVTFTGSQMWHMRDLGKDK